MNKEYFEQFVDELECLSQNCESHECVSDSAGTYSKAIVLGHLVTEARELIKYGEYRIALENLLENLNEVSLKLDNATINLARLALEEKNVADIELLLGMLKE
jgi:hypothetical protein